MTDIEDLADQLGVDPGDVMTALWLVGVLPYDGFVPSDVAADVAAWFSMDERRAA